MSENVNTTMNGTQPSSCPSNPTAEKIGKTFVYCLIFIVSLAGNTVIGIIFYKKNTMRKPINFFIVNMAMSDLLYPIIVIPKGIQQLYIDIQWSNCVIRYVFYVISFMVEANSAINPCICLILNKNYRNELRALFR